MNTEMKYNRVRALFSLTKASLLNISRNPSTLVFGILFPIILIAIFGFIGNGSSTYQVGFSTNTDKSNPIYVAVSKISNLSISNLSPTEQQSELTKGNISAIIDIQPGNYPNTANVYLLTTAADPQGGAIVSNIITSIANEINLAAAHPRTIAVKIITDQVAGRKFKTIDFILPGMLGFGLLSTGVISTAFVFVSLKKTLVIKRLFATPINPGLILIAEGISRLIFSLVQSIIIIGFGVIGYGYTLVNGLSTFLAMLVLSAIGLIVFLGFGLLVSSLVKNENAVPSVSNLITLPQFLLAGTFFPVAGFPDLLQKISSILPLTYFNTAMRKISFEGANFADISKELLVLVIWGIVIYAIAIKMFSWESEE